MNKIKRFIQEKILSSSWFPIFLTVILFFMSILLFFIGMFFLLLYIDLFGLILGIVTILIAVIAFCFTILFIIMMIIRVCLIKKSDILLQNEDIDGFISLIEKGFQLWVPFTRLVELDKKAKKAVPIVIQVLTKNKNKNARVNACWVLGEIKHKDAIPVLLECIKSDPAPIVRVNAVYALSNFGRKFKEKLPEIYTIIKYDPNPKNRINTALCLADLNITEALPVLKAEFEKDKDINEKFMFGWSIALLEGIHSDVIAVMEEMVNSDQLSGKSKIHFKDFYRNLVDSERSKKTPRRRISAPASTDLDLLRKEFQASHEETMRVVMGLKITEEREERIQRIKNFIPILTALIGAITAITTTLLIIFVK